MGAGNSWVVRPLAGEKDHAAMSPPSRRPGSSTLATLLRIVGTVVVGAVLLGVGLALPAKPPPPLPVASAPVTAPSASASAPAPVEVLRPLAITPAMRKKGVHECNPPDPLGLGPYAPYRAVSEGRIAIPQRGGHTADMGFDVVVHFHGADPVRKTVVQVARGVAYVAIDKGIGSGPYADAFMLPDRWPALKASITAALRKHTKDERAHIRHLGLSAWSAGYGAVNQILKQDAAGVDAVILLDGLHATYRFGITERDHAKLTSIDLGYIAPTVSYARRALAGEKLFVLTHSRIDPELYPGVGITADAILADLGLAREPANESAGLLRLTGTVDQKGFHVWSYGGRNEAAHCAHIAFMARALTEVVEREWDTPPMDRDVPRTPPPELGGGHRGGEGGAGAVLQPAAGGAPPSAPAPAPSASAEGGLEAPPIVVPAPGRPGAPEPTRL